MSEAERAVGEEIVKDFRSYKGKQPLDPGLILTITEIDFSAALSAADREEAPRIELLAQLAVI